MQIFSIQNRKCKRINFVCQADVAFSDDSFEAVTENLSLNGLFIRTDHQVPVGERGEISLNLSSSSNVSVGCVVVRNEEDGLAIQFKSVDYDSFARLKTVINRKSSYPLNEYFNTIRKQKMVSMMKAA
jgi:hypothetical protein